MVGTVIGLDSYYVLRRPDCPDQWMYVVSLWERSCWRTFLQNHLESEGVFDLETILFGHLPEISFDTILEEDNSFAEGSYRLPGGSWQVVIFQKEDVPEAVFRSRRWKKPTPWEQVATGLVIQLPQHRRLDREALIRALTLATDHDGWIEVSGPDSMNLR